MRASAAASIMPRGVSAVSGARGPGCRPGRGRSASVSGPPRNSTAAGCRTGNQSVARIRTRKRCEHLDEPAAVSAQADDHDRRARQVAGGAADELAGPAASRNSGIRRVHAVTRARRARRPGRRARPRALVTVIDEPTTLGTRQWSSPAADDWIAAQPAGGHDIIGHGTGTLGWPQKMSASGKFVGHAFLTGVHDRGCRRGGLNLGNVPRLDGIAEDDAGARRHGAGLWQVEGWFGKPRRLRWWADRWRFLPRRINLRRSGAAVRRPPVVPISINWWLDALDAPRRGSPRLPANRRGPPLFLEGMSHLRDPDWSSAGFRKAAVGPLADWYRAGLPETGDWSGTLARRDGRPAAEAAEALEASIASGWAKLLAERGAAVASDPPADGRGRHAARGRPQRTRRRRRRPRRRPRQLPARACAARRDAAVARIPTSAVRPRPRGQETEGARGAGSGLDEGRRGHRHQARRQLGRAAVGCGAAPGRRRRGAVAALEGRPVR